jgi:hypothetical protein
MKTLDMVDSCKGAPGGAGGVSFQKGMVRRSMIHLLVAMSHARRQIFQPW